jgi:HAD superfamily hydrolase (TIGR01509 family)
MTIRAVLFDLWETLIQDTPERSLPRRRWRTEGVCRLLAEHGFDVEFNAVLQALDATSRALTVLHDSGRDVDSAGRALLFAEHLEAGIGRRAPESSFASLEALIVSMPIDMAPTPAPHAAETLAAVKQLGLATGLVCNTGFTTAPHLIELLRAYELLPHFDACVFSDELRIAKPDPRIFQRAMDTLDLSSANCVFIGDNPHTDISGAMNAGLFAILIGSKYRDGITPHAQIDSLDQLIPTLRKHELVASP